MPFDLSLLRDIVALSILLCGAHWMGDYAFQSSYLAQAKTAGPLRLYHLAAHAGIHGFLVFLATQSVLLALAEWIAHGIIDELKVAGRTTYAQDQVLHFLCKLLWLLASFTVIGPPSFL